MLIYEKLGYNKIESRYIHDIILSSNNKYKENYFNKEHIELNNFNNLHGGTGIKKQEILSDEFENIKFIYLGHKIIFQKINYGDQIHYSLNTLDKKRECLVIILSENEIQTGKIKTMSADINQISMFHNCPLVGKMYKGGWYIVTKNSYRIY